MAQGEKRENSVLFSLRELRQIEENRVQEEDAAVRSAEEARMRAQQEQERLAREAEEARVRAERDHHRAIEEARFNAEREARMRVESAEATERARQQAALEQQRLHQEMEIRRAEVAKKRPTWMLAVTGIALVAAVGLIIFAIQRKNAADEAAANEAKQRAIAEQAVKDADEAKEKVEKLSADLADLDKKLSGAVDNVIAAQNDADRAGAKAKLVALQKEKADMEARIAAAKAAAAKAERAKGVKVSKECQDNPLAKGCM
jgi:hypothetical protein